MEIYVLTACGLLAASALSLDHRWKLEVPDRILASALFVWLVCVAAFRYDTGTDYWTYVDIWHSSIDLSDATPKNIIESFLEPLFVLTNACLAAFTSSDVAFFTFYSAATIGIALTAISRFRVSWSQSALVYFSMFYLPYTLNGMRQALAMSFLLLAIPTYTRQQTARVWIISLVAAGFHYSGALIVIGYYFFRLSERFHASPKKVFMVGLCLTAAIGFSGIGSSLFFTLFPYKVEVYAELFSESTGVVSIAIRTALCLVILWTLGSDRSRSVQAMVTVYLLGYFLYLALIDFNVIATRFNMFFRTVEVLLLPLALKRSAGTKRVTVAVVSVLIGTASLSVALASPDYVYRSVLWN